MDWTAIGAGAGAAADEMAQQQALGLRKQMVDLDSQRYNDANNRIVREENAQNSIRDSATQGLTNSANMLPDEKEFAMNKGLYEGAIKIGRPDLAAGYYQPMMQSRDALLANSYNRADQVYRTTGNLQGFADTYNKFVPDGQNIDSMKQNPDGSVNVAITDTHGGTSYNQTVTKDQVPTFLQTLQDPAKLRAIEAQRAQLAFQSQIKQQEELGKPMAIKNDETMIVPGTGQTYTPPKNAGAYDQKSANPVLDDVGKMFQQKYGIDRDPVTGMPKDPTAIPGWTDKGMAKFDLASRIYMKNPNIPPAMLAQIADNGTPGTATVKVNGVEQQVPAVTHQGRTYLLGGSDTGMPPPPPGQAAAKSDTAGTDAAWSNYPLLPESVSTRGLGTRSVTGKIGPRPGIQRASLNPTPPDWQQQIVQPDVQAERDVDAGNIILREYGGDVGKARSDLAEMDAALKRTTGDQRGIIQGLRDRLAAGLATQS